MAKTRASAPSRHPHNHNHKRNKNKYNKNKKNHAHTSPPPPSSASAIRPTHATTATTPAGPRAGVHTLVAASATPVPTWLGPRAPWHAARATRRIDQPRHGTPSPNETAWAARLREYLDRDDSAPHIPPRVYNTVLDTVRTPSRTTFARYGWVQAFAEYDVYAAANPGKYAYELWFGHRGMARASLDARQALMRSAAAYGDNNASSAEYTSGRVLTDIEADAVEIGDDGAVDRTNGARPSDSPPVMAMADYADDVYDDDELPFPMDPDEERGEGEDDGSAVGEVATLAPRPPQMLLDCADDDTF